MVTDLTKEHPNKTLWRFLLPMMLSVMFQQIYNIADSMIAGKFAGEDALAAVGASYPITVIFMAFAGTCPDELLSSFFFLASFYYFLYKFRLFRFQYSKLYSV